MMPSGLQAVFSRIAEVQQPPAAVAAFTNAYAAQAAAAKLAAEKTASATTTTTTTEVGEATSVAPTTVAGTTVTNIAAQRSVTAAVSTSLGTRSTLPAAAQPWLSAIRDAATRHGIDPDLLTSLVWTESSFQPDAVSPVGAIGLGQLMPGTAKSLGVDPKDPLQNLEGSARMLSGLITEFGRVDHALAAYNVGPNGLRRGLAEGRTPGAGYADAVAAKYRTITGRELF
jgi:soluble lytic murein transglycosylase-like protein